MLELPGVGDYGALLRRSKEEAEEFNNLGQGRFLQIPLPVFIATGISLILWALLTIALSAL